MGHLSTEFFVFFSVLCMVSAQGPRLTCTRCTALEEEIGNALQVHMPTLNIVELEALCPTLKQTNSTIYCNYIVELWKWKSLDEKSGAAKGSYFSQAIDYVIEKIEEWLGLDVANYNEICKFVDIC